jgi:hypothetical protein
VGKKIRGARGAGFPRQRRRRFYRSRAALAALGGLFDEYKTHEPFLYQRVNSGRATGMRARLQLELKRKAFRDKIYVIAVLALFVLDFLYVRLSKFL